MLILKFYIYSCTNSGENPSVKGSIAYLKYCIRIEQHTVNFLSTTQKEYINKKWLPLQPVLGDLNIL